MYGTAYVPTARHCVPRPQGARQSHRPVGTTCRHYLLYGTAFSKKVRLSPKKKVPAASLKHKKHGLGLPIHIKTVLISIIIGFLIFSN